MGNWRPNDWKQPYKFPEVFGNLSDYDFAYEHGASNMLEALITLINESCGKHPIPDGFMKGHRGIARNLIKWNGFAWVYSHRKDCPQCMAELRGNE